MCNRFRSLKDWSEVPLLLLIGRLLNFEFNPNVAPTELVPVFLARPEASPQTVMARFGITIPGKDRKPRQPLLNARTDGMRRGPFRSQLKDRRCIIPCRGMASR